MITAKNFREILDGYGYYDGGTFGSRDEVEEYLHWAAQELADDGSVWAPVVSHSDLSMLADLAVKHREHWDASPCDCHPIYVNGSWIHHNDCASSNE